MNNKGRPTTANQSRNVSIRSDLPIRNLLYRAIHGGEEVLGLI